MPHLTVPITTAGALFPVLIGISQARRTVLQAVIANAPQLQPARALLDTGATSTVVDNSIITALGLDPRGTTLMTTPSTGEKPVVAYLYDVSVWLMGTKLSDVLETSTQVIGADLKNLGFDVLLGRDILADCVVLYAGTAETCTLSF